MKTLIIVPTYNEKENINRLFHRLMAFDNSVHVLIVDDNSPDGTGSIAALAAERNPRIHVLRREKKNGLGPAYLAGFRWALERDYEVIMEMDADFSHRPRYLPAFFEAVKEADVVVGSRWMRGGRIANWPLHRVLLSRAASLYCKIVLGVPVYDMTAGYIAYRRKVLETLNLSEIHSDGYSFQIEMKYRALQHRFTIKEIPITFTDRKEGHSKISRHIVIEALIRVWVLRFQSGSLRQAARIPTTS